MKLYTGTDPYNGWQYLLTVWEDGTHEIATRPEFTATWGAPVPLMGQSSEVTS